MRPTFLLQFAQEHVKFKLTEFTSLASKHECNYDLITKPEDFEQIPFVLLETDNINSLIKLTKDSFLIKSLFELWGRSKISLEDLAIQVSLGPEYPRFLDAHGAETFRVNVDSFRIKLSQTEKVESIEAMKFLDDFTSRPDLKNPQQIYSIFIHKDYEYYFARHITEGNRSLIHKLNLKDRYFIANTTMDPQLSLICSNAARVKSDDLVYDPFVGSGSLLVAASHLGAYGMGGDIDWALLHGKSRPSRKNSLIRKEGESVRSNYKQYNIVDKYLDVLVSDISRFALVDRIKFDAIISDPPYGIREGSEKIGRKREVTKPSRNDLAVRYPSKISYELRDLLNDLLSLAAKQLTIGGRLVYFFMVPKHHSSTSESFIARHPSLFLVSHCEQPLTSKISRLMVVMEKSREPLGDDKVLVPEIIDASKFRELYFSSQKVDG